MDFTDKKVLITGGSRGIGRACAIGFAERGARVAINYLSNTSAAESTLSLLPGEGHVMLQADVSDPVAVEGLIPAAVEALGGLDIVVNNAGIWVDHALEEIDYDEWQDAWSRVLQANLVGPANVSYCAARHMIEHGGGRIVNVSSRGSFRGEPDGPAYGASKAGLNALSQSLAKRLAPYGIYVGVVAPGFVDTDMAARYLDTPMAAEIKAQSPLGRVAKPEEVAAAVFFLAAEGSEFSTGAIIDVNGASYLRT
jgi:3-oxoacyl-[acyl-carrier protein] reductase